jgi:hypothetical protein
VEGFQLIELGQIAPSPTNPRKKFDQGKLLELAESIAAKGVLQPVLVRPRPGSEQLRDHVTVRELDITGKTQRTLVAFSITNVGDIRQRADLLRGNGFQGDMRSACYEALKTVPGVTSLADVTTVAEGMYPDQGGFELVAGERRFRAAKLAGLPEIPATVRELTDVEVLEVQCIENDQRQDTLPERAGRPGTSGSSTPACRPRTWPPRWASRCRGSATPPARPGCRPRSWTPSTPAGSARRSPPWSPGCPARWPAERVAACVLAGRDRDSIERQELFGDKPIGRKEYEPGFDAPDRFLTYSETQDLIKEYCQVELKGAPFDRKALVILPEAGSCEACPKRAGNDPELVAAKVRADVCTDPECYRAKCEAWQAVLEAAAAATG